MEENAERDVCTKRNVTEDWGNLNIKQLLSFKYLSNIINSQIKKNEMARAFRNAQICW
jgi:hypothetical protein